MEDVVLFLFLINGFVFIIAIRFTLGLSVGGFVKLVESRGFIKGFGFAL
jgi:hypothetical protein